MDYRNAPAKKGTAIECDTDTYDSLETTDAEKEYSTVDYDKEDEIVDIALKSKYDIRKAQLNVETSNNTASKNNQTPITSVSKFSLIVVIVALVVFTVAIVIASSVVTAKILKQEFEKDLKKNIKEEITSFHLNNITDKESVWSIWSAWGECSGTCNGGIRKRKRTCATSGMDGSRGACIGNDVDITTCSNDFCVESVWVAWSEWGECIGPCDVGIRRRNRTCEQSEANRSLDICTGNDVDISNCNNELCAESVWSTWSDWGGCSVTCNGGIRTRNRSCDTSDMNESRGTCTGANVDISTCKHEFCTDKLFELLQQSKFGGSSTYVRWGRTTCPSNGTELVYEGYAGGSYPHHSGGAADYLCLPKDPDWGHYEDALQEGGFVYGGEYEYNLRASSANFFASQSSNLREKDVPCAVCRSTRSSVLMVPAKNRCHAGWTHEYHGYLSAGRYTHPAPSEYVCVDGETEVLDGGKNDQNGVLFYFVEGRCGSLKCPPYVNGRELTCVVCTK